MNHKNLGLKYLLDIRNKEKVFNFQWQLAQKVFYCQLPPHSPNIRLLEYNSFLKIRKFVLRLVPIITFCILMMLPALLLGQEQNNLEVKRKKLLQEIGQTNNRLAKTKKNKASTFNQYLSLQSSVKTREELIENYAAEIHDIDTAIIRTTAVIEALQEDQKGLKQDYAAMLRHAYRLKLNNNSLQFLFASSDFNEAYQRWQYLRQYDRYRKKQVRLIQETQLTLEKKRTGLAENKAEKQVFLEEMQEQKEIAGKEMGQMNKLLSKLKGDEKALINQLKKQQKAHNKLSAAIENFIRKEMDRKRKAARSKEGLTSSEDKSKSDKLSSVFAQNKGRLPWPVKKGTIVSYFGRQNHASIKGIKISNNGIDIRTKKGAKVLAIFDGKVAGTQFIPGYQNMVIIQHGHYYSVYSNLDQIAVKRNDVIKKGQLVGKVGTKKPDLHFEIWREKKRQNPVKWIK